MLQSTQIYLIFCYAGGAWAATRAFREQTKGRIKGLGGRLLTKGGRSFRMFLAGLG